MAKRRSGSTNYRNRKTTKSKGPIKSLFSMAKDLAKSSPISKLFGSDSEFKVGGDSKGAKFTPAATAQRKKNMRISGQRMLKSPKFQKAVSDAAESAIDIGGIAKIKKITDIAGKVHKIQTPKSVKETRKTKLKKDYKLAQQSKAERAPARKEGEAFRESRGTLRIEEVKPSIKDTPTVLRKDPRDTPTQQFDKEMKERQRLMSSTKASDVRKAMAPEKKIRDETRGFKSEFVGPGKRDIGGGKTQLWVDDADVIAATNKSPEKGFKKAQIKLSQEKDRLAGQNRHMIEHHQLVPDAVRQKKASRVQIKVTPPELRGLEKGTETDIRGLQSSLKESGATVHGSTRSFTPEELASETTKTFKKRTKEYALKQKKSEDLKIGIVKRHATGKKTPKVRAFPEKITMKEIGQGKVGEFKKKQALKIQRKEEGYKKASKTKAEKQKKSGKTQVKRDITNAQANRIVNKALGQQGVKEAEKWAKRASKRIPF